MANLNRLFSAAVVQLLLLLSTTCVALRAEALLRRNAPLTGNKVYYDFTVQRRALSTDGNIKSGLLINVTSKYWGHLWVTRIENQQKYER